MNVVMTGGGHFVELQATAEGRPLRQRNAGFARACGGRNPAIERSATIGLARKIGCPWPLRFSSRRRTQES